MREGEAKESINKGTCTSTCITLEACNSLGCKWPSFQPILGLISCTCAVHTHIHVQSYK